MGSKPIGAEQLPILLFEDFPETRRIAFGCMSMDQSEPDRTIVSTKAGFRELALKSMEHDFTKDPVVK